MIRKLSAFLILAFIGWGYLQAQEAKTCFKNMPDSICPLPCQVLYDRLEGAGCFVLPAGIARSG